MCARVYVGGRKEPPASRRLGHSCCIPIERGPASPLRYPRVPTTTVTWSARAPIPSIFRLRPPPQFSNRDLRSRTLRSSSFAFPNLQFPTSRGPSPFLSFPFLSVSVPVENRKDANFHVSFRSPSFLHQYFVQSGVIANFSLEGNEKWRSGSKGERQISMLRRVL